MEPTIPLFPDQASTVAVTGGQPVLLHDCRQRVLRGGGDAHGRVFRDQVSAAPRRRGGRADSWIAGAGAALDGHSVRDRDGDVRVGLERLFRPGPRARGSARHLRRRQAVDVEVPAPRGPARDQRAARAGEHARAHDHHLGRRAARPVLPVVPREDRRHSRPLHAGVVQRHQDRHLPHLLRRVLRDEALGHDRLGPRAAGRRVPGVAGRHQHRRVAGAARREAVHAAGVHHVSQPQLGGPGSGPPRRMGPHRAAGQRQHGDGRRVVRPRVDSQPDGQDRRRLSAADADVPGAGHRRAAARADRIHQGAGGRRSRCRRAAAPAAPAPVPAPPQ